MDLGLAGKTATVTGASAGIGKEVAAAPTSIRSPEPVSKGVGAPV